MEMGFLDKSLVQTVHSNALDERTLEARKSIRKYIQTFLQNHYCQTVTLDAIGSSVNGFGIRSSDLDLSLNVPGVGLDEAKIVKNVACILEQDVNVRQVNAIPGAKTPIVKFVFLTHKFTQRLNVDICINNELGIKTSALLLTYSKIYPRVRDLGRFIKIVAKKLDITNAKEKTLSSYSWIILVIHFLRQQNPPSRTCSAELIWVGETRGTHQNMEHVFFQQCEINSSDMERDS